MKSPWKRKYRVEMYYLLLGYLHESSWIQCFPVASFTKEVNPRLAKRPLKINGRLANRGLTSIVKEATGLISKTIYELNYMIFLHEKSPANQVIILRMPWQPSCPELYKIVT